MIGNSGTFPKIYVFSLWDMFDCAGNVYKIIYQLVWLSITKQITPTVISLKNSFERTAQALRQLLFSDLFKLISNRFHRKGKPVSPFIFPLFFQCPDLL